MCSLTALLLQPLTERAYLQSMALLPHLLKQRILVILPRCGSAVLPSVCLSVCLSASISLEPLDRSSRNSLCRSPVAVARSSCGGVAIRYVLPVLWMTSCLAVWRCVDGRPSSVATAGHSLMSVNTGLVDLVAMRRDF